MSNVVMLDETPLSGMMVRQAMSWSSKVHVDEVAAILFEAAYRVLVAAYGSRQIDEHLDRTSKIAAARLSDEDGGGPNHRHERCCMTLDRFGRRVGSSCQGDMLVVGGYSLCAPR